MKIKSSLKSIKKRDLNTNLVRRRGRVYVINKTNPDTFIPSHGETFFLKKHSEWVRSQKTNIRSFNILNFDIWG